jgi:hypothetical protein
MELPVLWAFRLGLPLATVALGVSLKRHGPEPSFKRRLAEVVPHTSPTCPLCNGVLVTASPSFCNTCGAKHLPLKTPAAFYEVVRVKRQFLLTVWVVVNSIVVARSFRRGVARGDGSVHSERWSRAASRGSGDVRVAATTFYPCRRQAGHNILRSPNGDRRGSPSAAPHLTCGRLQRPGGVTSCWHPEL